MAVGEDFITLDLEVLGVACEGCGVICIPQATRVVLVCLGWGETSLSVAPPPSFKPSMEGLYEDEEEEGGEGVSLDGAPTQ